jgi:hypothetical protein
VDHSSWILLSAQSKMLGHDRSTACPKIGFEGPPESFGSGQFAVSKCRIIANPYEHYAYLSELLEAPEGHWVLETPR